MVWILAIFTLLGFNFTIWLLIGLLRLNRETNGFSDIKNGKPSHSLLKWVLVFFAVSGLNNIFAYIWKKIKQINIKSLKKISYRVFNNKPPADHSHDYLNYNSNKNKIRIKTREVAAIIPAHNEEMVIASALKSLKKIMPADNIYVGSDASTDSTVQIVKDLGCRVVDIQPNKGKANVLVFLLDYFKIIERYKAVIIIDADSELDENYLLKGLPLFDNSQVMAVAAHVKSKWQPGLLQSWATFFSAYRVRLYRIVQLAMRYGQTWKHTNVTTIIPGFASMYRTEALKHLTINAPGLVIEDYNMTFELHHKKLGSIAYSPQVIGYTQDPGNFKDYFKQVKRWNLGFWQTVRRHGFWPSAFWLSLGPFILEMLFFSLILLITPILFILFAFNNFAAISLPFVLPIINSSSLNFSGFIVAILIIDYLITFIISILEKKPLLLFYGLGFFFLRYIDALIFIYTLPLAFIAKSDGRWISPKRFNKTMVKTTS